MRKTSDTKTVIYYLLFHSSNELFSVLSVYWASVLHSTFGFAHYSIVYAVGQQNRYSLWNNILTLVWCSCCAYNRVMLIWATLLSTALTECVILTFLPSVRLQAKWWGNIWSKLLQAPAVIWLPFCVTLRVICQLLRKNQILISSWLKNGHGWQMSQLS
jgi:hypothetical protein